MLRSLALAAALALPAGATLAQSATVDFVNASGATVYYLHMSAAHTTTWETDLLGDSVLLPGQTLTVTRTGMNECLYDVLIEWESGAQLQDQFDLCTYGRYIIQ